MPKPTAIVTSALPPERLNQIAGGKLQALGVPVRLEPGEKTLSGEVTFRSGSVVLRGAPIPSARFAVVGHDHLAFEKPPLSALGPILFFDLATVQALEQRVAATLQQRLSALAVAGDQLKRLQLPPRFDEQRLRLLADVKTATQVFELATDGAAAWVSQVTPIGGAPVPLPERAHAVDLRRFQTAIDLELELVDRVGTLQPAPRLAAPSPAAEAGPAVLLPVPAPASAVTLATLVEKFGAGATVGASQPGAISQDFTVNGVTYRFSAVHVGGTTFHGALNGPNVQKWADKFDVMRFPGVESVAASVLGARLPQEQPQAAAVGSGASPFPSHLKPQVGEIWVMNVLIEREENGEVRYACSNVDGKPFGATRILKRTEFEEVFVQSGGGWRLLIVMEEIRPDHSVVYRQLDANRQPRGAPKRMEGAILVTTFVPEAMAY
jgi:hypothetical protein